MKRLNIILLLIILFTQTSNIFACTNFIVTKGASVDGSAYVVYTNDGEWLYHLQKFPAKDYKKGEMLKLGNGEIPQVAHTYAMVGFHMNEFQLSIGETTFTGREELWKKTNHIKYWHLMQLALQRAKTAREAIKVMTDIVEKYGYGSEGESFSIADPNEAWILEMIGTNKEKGAIWVAMKIPDGYVSGHANMARIGEFPLNDKENCIYSENIISFAIEKGYYKKDSKIPFSFKDVYNPATPERLKYCESRVWSMFTRVSPSLNLSPDYHRGVKGTKRYPLWIKPDKKLDLQNVINIIRDHYEGTDLDMTKGIAAGPFGNPNRHRPLSWKVDSVNYSWERAISIYNSAFSFIAQMRSWLPNKIGGIVWFGEDDTYTTCYLPIYIGVNDIPKAYKTGDIKKFSWESAWWVFNFVSNYANIRYSYMIKDIQNVQNELETKFIADRDSIDKLALNIYKTDKDKTSEFLTNYVVNLGDNQIKQWIELGNFLIMKYNDGYIKNDKMEIKQEGYPKDWLQKVVKDNPEKYKINNWEKTDCLKYIPY